MTLGQDISRLNQTEPVHIAPFAYTPVWANGTGFDPETLQNWLDDGDSPLNEPKMGQMLPPNRHQYRLSSSSSISSRNRR